jgi:hypothetical protein
MGSVFQTEKRRTVAERDTCHADRSEGSRRRCWITLSVERGAGFVGKIPRGA